SAPRKRRPPRTRRQGCCPPQPRRALALNRGGRQPHWVSPGRRRPQGTRRQGDNPKALGKSRPRYLAATAQLPLAFRFDSFANAVTGSSANSSVLKIRLTPSLPAPASPVSVIAKPWALWN